MLNTAHFSLGSVVQVYVGTRVGSRVMGSIGEGHGGVVSGIMG